MRKSQRSTLVAERTSLPMLQQEQRSAGNPQDPLRNTTRDLLAKDEIHLEYIDREIDVLREAVQRLHILESEREEVAKRIFLYRARISSLNKIPPEILGKIFCNIGYGNVFLPIDRDAYPWVLGQVCSVWRSIMWSTPDLWKNIVISDMQSNGKRHLWHQNVQTNLDIIISRMASPISLSMSHFRPDDNSTLELLIPQMPHIKGLTIDNLSYSSFRRLMDLPTSSFHSLQSLEIHISHLNSSHTTQVLTLESAPNLREVVLTYERQFPPRVAPPPPIALPWAHLTMASISQLTPHIWDILGQSTLLTHLHLTIYQRPPPNTLQIIHLNLQNLSLTVLDEIDWEYFLRHLVLPALKALEVKCYHKRVGKRWNNEALTSLINRSNCKIESLHIDDRIDIDINEIDPPMASLLRCLSTVKFFHIIAMTPPHTLHAIFHEGFLPNLEKVTWFLNLNGFNDLLDTLDEFMGDREHPCSRRGLEIVIHCPTRLRTRPTYRRYTKSTETYLRAGIILRLCDIFSSSGHNFHDYTDGESEGGLDGGPASGDDYDSDW